MSKMLYTRFTKLIIDYILSHSKSIPRKIDFKLHSSQDDQPITKLLNITNGKFKFGMEVPDAMISDAIKKKAGYTYYMAKKVESEEAKNFDEPEEQYISSVKSGRGKGFMCYGDQVANVPNKLKKDVMPRKTRSLIIAEEAVVGDDNAARYEVFMHNKFNVTPNSTYLSLTVTSSLLDIIQTLLDETPANELTDFMSHPVYTDAHTILVVHNPEGNPEQISCISGASKVPLGTYVYVLATKTLMQEMFPDENAHHIPSPPAKKIPYPITTLQPNSLQAKSKKLMQKTKNNIRKINFKKAATEEWRDLPAGFLDKGTWEVEERVWNRFGEVQVYGVVSGDERGTGIHSNKSNETHSTHQQLYDALYESITLNQDALDAQAAQSSFHKRSHNNQDPPNNYMRPSIIAIAKKFKELIQKDEVTISYFKGIGLEWLKEEDRIDFFKVGMNVVTEGNVYSYLRIKSVVFIVVKEKWGYGFLTSIVVSRSDDKEYEFSYADLHRLSDVEDMYLLQV
nr:hypothetical protein [Tanacetum cinerariifolium]